MMDDQVQTVHLLFLKCINSSFVGVFPETVKIHSCYFSTCEMQENTRGPRWLCIAHLITSFDLIGHSVQE